MRDLATMTVDDFIEFERKTFDIISAEAQVSLQLIEVAKLGQSERAGGSFSLLFQGPSDPHLEQGIYRLAQPDFGEHDVFLVPVSEQSNGYQYESIFT